MLLVRARYALRAAPYGGVRNAQRLFSCAAVRLSGLQLSEASPVTDSLNPRWLSETKSRVGKCIMFGLKPHQTKEAGDILQEIAQDWRELVAGSEGYLTGEDRRGLYKQEVVWGEMVCFLTAICTYSYFQNSSICSFNLNANWPSSCYLGLNGKCIQLATPATRVSVRG